MKELQEIQTFPHLSHSLSLSYLAQFSSSFHLSEREIENYSSCASKREIQIEEKNQTNNS